MGRNLVRFVSLILPAFASVVGLALHARAQAEDPIAARLEKAKEAYAASEESYRKTILERLQAAEERATKAGNKAAVDQAVADREDFEANGTTPKSLKINDLQIQRKQSRARLLDAYNRAISEYTRRRNRPEADAVEREMAEFKAKSSGGELEAGTVWRGEKKYTRGGPPGLHTFELKVTERRGDSFKGIITEIQGGGARGIGGQPPLSHDVEGTVEGDKVSWKNTRTRSGPYPGQPQDGVLTGDTMKLHFARKEQGTPQVEAEGVIKLQKEKKK